MSARSEPQRPRSRGAEMAVLATAGLALLACTWHAARQSDTTLRLGLWWVYTGCAALGVGFVQALFPRTRTGVGVTVALAGFGVGMAGQHDAPRGPFALACVLYLFAAQYALRRADPTRPAPRLPKDRRGLAAVVLGVAAVSAAISLALPPAHHTFVHMATRSFYRNLERAALGDQLELGALNGLARSDRVVLRIEGNEPYALRGVVYDEYRRTQWRSARSSQSRAEALDVAGAAEPVAPAPTRGVFVEQRVQGPWRTYYVPLGHAATALAQVPGLRSDSYGVLHPPLGEMANRIELGFGAGSVQPSPATFAHAAPAPPDERIDLGVPEHLRKPLIALALQWAGAATGPAEVMAALERSLMRANRYSLEVPAPARGVDPVHAFLFVHKRGHCEYFASALALLGRTMGVPTRVVAGYRSGDYNSVGRYFMVRDRHAHSWVEAYIPGRGWRTYDATPAAPDAPMVSRPVPWLAGVWDAMFERIAAWWRWLRGRPPTDALYIAAVLAAGFGLNRLRKRRGDDEDPTRAFAARASEVEPTPASYEALCRALEARGVARSAAEPLERYADRVAREPGLGADDTGLRAAAALRAYATLRYGREGDEAQVVRDLAASAAELVAGAAGGVRPAAQQS